MQYCSAILDTIPAGKHKPGGWMEDKLLTDFLGQYSLEVKELIRKARTMLARELPDAREMVDIPSRIITYGYSPKYKDLVMCHRSL
jgi:hypothetical protein